MLRGRVLFAVLATVANILLLSAGVCHAAGDPPEIHRIMEALLDKQGWSPPHGLSAGGSSSSDSGRASRPLQNAAHLEASSSGEAPRIRTADNPLYKAPDDWMVGSSVPAAQHSNELTIDSNNISFPVPKQLGDTRMLNWHEPQTRRVVHRWAPWVGFTTWNGKYMDVGRAPAGGRLPNEREQLDQALKDMREKGFIVTRSSRFGVQRYQTYDVAKNKWENTGWDTGSSSAAPQGRIPILDSSVNPATDPVPRSRRRVTNRLPSSEGAGPSLLPGQSSGAGPSGAANLPSGRQSRSSSSSGDGSGGWRPA
ncbi:hypothetical protein CBOM_06076 [Ceraceosorus bombacis]|uniref:Uncharacterized protein n=1 Tax=Ceraceosorus bombacis TaxID=401625 RepID=A0A0P1BJ06_9BASI|nr:hypothetical protein CBOM_06076 [Ceraceosorus bombacis]